MELRGAALTLNSICPALPGLCNSLIVSLIESHGGISLFTEEAADSCGLTPNKACFSDND
jgi:hypothetical protein